jgi:tryptophan-rich sensory protein
MSRLKIFIVFFILNFGGLYLGGLFTGSGVSSDWYNNLNQAPWTPPGVMFGIAWTSIMICFSFYMTSLYQAIAQRKSALLLFGLQWILNVAWSPVFFHFQLTGIALVIISALTLVVLGFMIFYTKQNHLIGLLLLPYLGWLLIATSLNAYIFLNN